MTYKRGKRFGLSEERQSLIYWTCIDYKNQSEPMKHKILDMCLRHGGQYYQALFEAVTTRKSIRSIAMHGFIDESGLSRKVKRFYNDW